MDKKPTREEAEKLLGKRTPLPAGRTGGGLNDLPTPPTPRRAASTPLAEGAKGFDPLYLKERDKRMKENIDAMACGGRVKKYASGGMVSRGTGCQTQGKKKVRVF